MLNIYFLGKTNIEYNGHNITEKVGNKTLALICLLVLNHNKYLSREKIITYLWPDSNEEAAKYNLRFNLWLIKKNIGLDEKGEAFLRVDRDTCEINENYSYKCDIVEIKDFKPSESDSVESLQKLRELFVGDFMEGCYFSNCNDFNEIIIFERNKFEDRKVKILKRLVDLFEQAANLEACEEILKEIMEIEPYDEEMALKIIDLYEKEGKRCTAIIFYNSFKNKLMGCLGIQPSDVLKKRYQNMKESNLEGDYSAQTSQTVDYKKNKDSPKKQITIETSCICCVQYFWLSDVIGKLFECEALECNKYLSEREILDLGYIQPNILPNGNLEINLNTVPDVRIVNSFFKLISKISKENRLIIRIHNLNEMDEFSTSIFKYLNDSDSIAFEY
ncbi:MAG: BTAD domain-containing putative transcriptional regulator [Aminipila sp.]